MTNEGGPAFPVVDMSKTQCLGMTLRDWFAGQALVGAVAGGRGLVISHTMFASSAYAIADAMLAEREKGGAK